jgi:hypothetical protein
MKDEIVEEIRKIREEYAAQFDFDIARICEDIRERERTSGREYVSLPPKRIVPMVLIPVLEATESDPDPSLASPATRES